MLPNPNRTTALLVGSGAVQNAWDPVQKAAGTPQQPTPTVEGANFVCALEVYQRRKVAEDQMGRNVPPPRFDGLANLKQRIAKEVKMAQQDGTLQPRPELEYIFQRIIRPSCENLLLINANWDTVVDCALDSVNKKSTPSLRIDICHIHGVATEAQSLYLPSETANEPYLPQDHRKARHTAHEYLWLRLCNVNRIIIYGLSLNPMDAELASILAQSACMTFLEEVVVIDPKYEPVVEKLRICLNPVNDVRINGVKPCDLLQYHTS